MMFLIYLILISTAISTTCYFIGRSHGAKQALELKAGEGWIKASNINISMNKDQPFDSIDLTMGAGRSASIEIDDVLPETIDLLTGKKEVFDQDQPWSP